MDGKFFSYRFDKLFPYACFMSVGLQKIKVTPICMLHECCTLKKSNGPAHELGKDMEVPASCKYGSYYPPR